MLVIQTCKVKLIFRSPIHEDLQPLVEAMWTDLVSSMREKAEAAGGGLGAFGTSVAMWYALRNRLVKHA
jgi:hypothetical protein